MTHTRSGPPVKYSHAITRDATTLKRPRPTACCSRAAEIFNFRLIRSDSIARNFICDKLATDHSVCTGRATSCTHMSLRQVASCVLETFLKSLSLRHNFVAATSRKKKHCATCWGDKILLQP